MLPLQWKQNGHCAEQCNIYPLAALDWKVEPLGLEIRRFNLFKRQPVVRIRWRAVL
jgi:hypothetical protein